MTPKTDDLIIAFDVKHCYGLIWMRIYRDCCLAPVTSGLSPLTHPLVTVMAIKLV